MNTTEQQTDTFEATVIRIKRETHSTRGLVDFVSDLSPEARRIRIQRVRTGRADSNAVRLLAKQIQLLVGHRVRVNVALETSARVRRIVGVVDLGVDPHFVADDPRTPEEQQPVITRNLGDVRDLETEFTGEVTEVDDLASGILTVRLSVGTDLSIEFLGLDSEANAIAARSLLGKRATITGLPHESPSGSNALMLSRIVEASV